MCQEMPAILDYGRPAARGPSSQVGAGFIFGWIVGAVAAGAIVAQLLLQMVGGIGMIVVLIFLGTLLGSLPFFALVHRLNRSMRFGNAIAFVIAVVCSPCVSFGLLAAFVWWYRSVLGA